MVELQQTRHHNVKAQRTTDASKTSAHIAFNLVKKIIQLSLNAEGALSDGHQNAQKVYKKSLFCKLIFNKSNCSVKLFIKQPFMYIYPEKKLRITNSTI